MARSRNVELGFARGRRAVVDVCRELDAARLEHGLSYASLGRAVGMSGDQAARICRGQAPNVPIAVLSGLLAAAGLHLSARAYPGDSPVRDAAHLAVLARFRGRIGPATRWRTEVPVVGASGEAVPPAPRDRRAWDAVVEGAAWRVGVEAETRLHDVQAFQRRLALKQRDGNVTAVVVVVNDTAHNRRVLKLDRVELLAQFPSSARSTLRRLATGRSPDGNAIVVL